METAVKTTRKQRVYDHLLEAKRSKIDQGWVNGTDLTTENIGGPQGLRYVRFLRSEGYSISMRRHEGVYQYRLDRVKPTSA